MLKYIALLLLLLLEKNSFSQEKNIVPGEWRVHLPYNDVFTIAETKDRIYASSTKGLFAVIKDGENVERLSKINGFSDVEITAMKYSTENDVLVICYENGNIDLVKNKSIINVTDVLRKTIIGLKRIYHINFNEQFAYLSTSFGIVVMDLNKIEIKESYTDIGPNGTVIPVFSTAITGDTLFAATNKGVIYGKIGTTINLADFNQWKTLIAANSCKHVAAFRKTLFLEIDSVLYTMANSILTPFDNTDKRVISSLDVSFGKMTIAQYGKIILIDNNGNRNELPTNQVNYAITDQINRLWFGSNQFGLAKRESWGQVFYYSPNGPSSHTNYHMLCDGDAMWVTAGGTAVSYNPIFITSGFYKFENNNWHNKEGNPFTDGTWDWTFLSINPVNKRVYATTHGTGLVEFEKGVAINRYTHLNSPIPYQNTITFWNIVNGVAHDNKGNMWISAYEADSSLLVKTLSGQWKAFRTNSKNGPITIDKFGNKWIITPRSNTGILVYNDNNTPLNQADDQMVFLSNATGSGALPNNNVNCIAATPDGEIWIGTDEGLAVIFSPQNIFKGGNFDAKKIIIEQNGVAGYLLGDEVINCITIDGAGRKWIGTNNGAWLISKNGQSIERNFTTENSPLLSNTIKSIGIMDKTGEVFFGTDKGIISFRGNATVASENLGNIKIFPNPVKENFDSDVSITGLSENTTVKITDINGNIIFETVSLGGTASWNCRTFSGIRPVTGVYLVFCINKDGTETQAGKILFIH